MKLLLAEHKSDREGHLVDEKEYPEENDLNDEPLVSSVLSLTAGLSILASNNDHYINEGANAVQGGYGRHIPDLHEVDADANDSK